MNRSPHHLDRHGPNMRVRILGQKRNHPRENFRLCGAARPRLASVAGQGVQDRTANPVTRVIEHRDQTVDDLRYKETIEELAASKTHIGHAQDTNTVTATCKDGLYRHEAFRRL
jgi:hypothetical protein